MTTPIWTPSPERIRASHLHAWAEQLRARHGVGEGYAALHRWSVAQHETFWAEAWADAGVTVSAPHTAVLASREMPLLRGPEREGWFPGLRFNFAEHLLRWNDDHPALIAEGEASPRRTLSYRELRRQVARCAAGLRGLGVAPGDRVAGFLPNTVETVVAMLATAALGAIWSSTSPDFGFRGVMERFGQIDPKVLICADGYHYNGKAHDSLEKAAHLLQEIPSIQHLVVVPFLTSGPEGAAAGGTPLPRKARTWDDLLQPQQPEPPLSFVQGPFDAPLYIMYSSGTTGVPKCIVHGAGGTLLKHHVEHKFHTDVHREDVLFYFTTCGWMMWNWLVSGLAQGATLVLYDGSPAWPDGMRLFQLAQETGISILGTSPKFLASVQKAGLKPGEALPLPRLRTLLSTGAPLEPGQYDYVYESVKRDLLLGSIAGGTDIIGCFMASNPLQPVYRGEIQGAGLGVDLAAFDETGGPVVGQQGELVCRQPLPSMPLHFWNDPEGRRFRETYFADYPGVWRHGDFITLTERGGVIVYGRSDATLNPGGVRIGTAEIYRIVEALDFVQDSIVVGRHTEGGEEVVLFVVLAPGQTLDSGLENQIRSAVRAAATPRHVPAHIRQIEEVPVTINGKKVELAVAALLHGRAVKNQDALANPAALHQFEGLVF